jgi:hypothetical protein
MQKYSRRWLQVDGTIATTQSVDKCVLKTRNAVYAAEKGCVSC